MQQIVIPLLFGLLTMSLVTVNAAQYTCPSNAQGTDYYVDYSGSKQYQCFNSLDAAIRSVEENETAEIVLLKDNSWASSTVVIDKNVTINLNKHKAVFSGTGVWKVTGANVTIKNGTIDMATNNAAARIKVDSATEASTLTIAKDVKVLEGAAQNNSAVEVISAAEKTVVNLNGTWEINNEIVNCLQKEDEDLTINLNANVTSKGLSTNNALIVLDAGNSVVNVNGGTYKSNEMVFTLVNGTLNVNGGTMTSTGDAAIWVKEPGEDLTNTLKIAGGTITSEKNNAVYFESAKGTYSISNGLLTGGKDSNKKQLPALGIYKTSEFLASHKNMITGGSFTGSIVGDVEEDGRLTKAEKAIADLVGNATDKNYSPI